MSPSINAQLLQTVRRFYRSDTIRQQFGDQSGTSEFLLNPLRFLSTCSAKETSTPQDQQLAECGVGPISRPQCQSRRSSLRALDPPFIALSALDRASASSVSCPGGWRPAWCGSCCASIGSSFRIFVISLRKGLNVVSRKVHCATPQLAHAQPLPNYCATCSTSFLPLGCHQLPRRASVCNEKSHCCM